MMVICDKVLRVIHACEGDDTATGGSDRIRMCPHVRACGANVVAGVRMATSPIVGIGVAIGVADGTSTAYNGSHTMGIQPTRVRSVCPRKPRYTHLAHITRTRVIWRIRLASYAPDTRDRDV